MLPVAHISGMQRFLPCLRRAQRHRLSPVTLPVWKGCRYSSIYRLPEIPKATGQMSPREENMAKEKAYRMQVDEIRTLADKRMAEALDEAKGSGNGSQDSQSSDTAEIQRKLQSAIQEMQVGLIERDTEVRLMLLAALSGEHILFIGPPGTAKSELGRRLSRLYKGSFFERLLTRFSVPEELFGPLSMRELENDQYVRQTKGYLPEASVAFVDEIFKANSAILNTLLTILNERLFDNGSERNKVPLICMVGASNELPESEELDALYDRFLIRRRVSQVSTGGLIDLLSDPNLTVDALLDDQSSSQGGVVDLSQEIFRNVRTDAVKQVSVPDEVKQLLVDIRMYLQDRCNPPVYVSDRRLLKSVALLKVAAYTSGRKAVSPYDCLLLQHILWAEPEQSERIREFLISQLAADERTIEQTDYLFKGMFARACVVAAPPKNKPGASPAPKNVQAEELLTELRAMKAMLISKMASIYQSTSEEPGSFAPSIWSSPDDQDAVATALSPKLLKAQQGVTELLYEVVTLEVMLSNAHAIKAYDLCMALPKRWDVYIKNPAPAMK